MLRLLLLLVLFSSCANRMASPPGEVKSYRSGDSLLFCNDDFFPIENFISNKEAVWQLLDRATMHLVRDDKERSLTDFQSALDAIDYYRDTILSEQTAQLLIDDSKAAYIPPLYESLLARTMAACACFQANDFSNAKAMLRQAEEVESFEKELKQIGNTPLNPIATYLLAAAFEHEEDLSQANILYKRLELKDGISIQNSSNATLLCLIHEGLLPEKESVVAPVSIVSMQLLELLLKAWDIEPAISSLTGIAVPVFIEDTSPCYPLLVRLDGVSMPCVVTHDILETAKSDLDNRMTVIATRAAARQLIRRAGVSYAYQKDHTLGLVADIGALITNLMTKADTRMWHTLPREMRLLRLEIPPGKHMIDFSSGKTYSIELRAGDLCLIQVFCPNGHPTHVLLPNTR